MKRFITYCCLFAAFCGPCASLASSAEETSDSGAKAKLAEVRARISALTSRLGSELKDRDALAARLRTAELEVTAKRQQLDRLHSAQAAAERRRTELRTEQARIEGALDAQRAALASQVRAAYMMGEQERIKLLLNQSGPAGAGRMSAFYGYFARERAQKIAQINERVNRVHDLVAQIDQTSEKLRALQIEAGREMTDLQHAREERVVALSELAKQVSSGTEELARLKREEQAEEALVANLAQVLQDFPIDTQQSFAGLRGKLPWPVQGRMTARYQEVRANAGQSALRWNGVLIEAARGAKVRAPYFGRVVYADWLQGLGLLLIIGHKGDYMTLYGHAEVLYKSVGDWVAPGDVIAALGDSSGAAPQLYFEVREGRKTVDPRIWLKTAP